ncbi:MAG: hypothetical protein NTY19_29155 [Planctomycetota bacterium]|nr:hypothetical protein [Planctomycetota bacterium]
MFFSRRGVLQLLQLTLFAVAMSWLGQLGLGQTWSPSKPEGPLLDSPKNAYPDGAPPWRVAPSEWSPPVESQTAAGRSSTTSRVAEFPRPVNPQPTDPPRIGSQLAGLSPPTDPSSSCPVSAAAFPLVPERWTRNYQASLTLATQDYDPLGQSTSWGDWYRLECLARGYYVNDQRIAWTGQEETFGVAGIVAGILRRPYGEWEVGLESELYLNQPYDRNLLVDTPQRRSYRGNFEVQTLEISQLLLSARSGDWLFAMGKMVTPFGRTYFPVYLNDRRDAPFIRTESILWRETGALVQYNPSPLVLTAAVVNGSQDQDTNSSKGIISRIGLEGENYAVGASVKWQDGIGSEGQKQYNNHVGVDALVRRGAWILSGEAIYDQYGFHRPGFSPIDITWYHSIYYRDQNFAVKQPLTGVGYYVNLGYEAEYWTGMLNYGEFYPEHIGDPHHDAVTRRGIVKFIYHFNPMCDLFSTVMLENNLPDAQGDRTRKGQFVLGGFQIKF